MDDPLPAPKKAPGEAWREEPILPKQKAVLEFLKMPTPPTRGGASNLIKAVFEGPAGNAHQNAWEVAKHKLHPNLYPPTLPPEPSAPPSSGSLLGIVSKMAVLVGLGFFAWQYFQQDSDSPKTNDASIFTAPVPQPTVPASSPSPESKPVSDMITLQSTDGRTIHAKVLALTKETVLIRREDGQTFDLQLDRLTPDSKKRIEEYRAAKRAGLFK